MDNLILFVNVLVTDQRASAGGMNRADRLDIFKYTLASYAKIDRIKNVIIYCQLDGSYQSREKELRDYIDNIFYFSTVRYHNYSPSNQTQWVEALLSSPLLTTSSPILYLGNDDHVFIDYDTDVLYEGLDLMAKEPTNQINTLHCSSWTEAISTVYGLNDYIPNGRYWKASLLYSDAIQIVNSTFFNHIFMDLEIGNDYMRRTDNILTNWYPTLGDYKYSSRAQHPIVQTFIPLRELVRHFDAYWHIGVPFEYVPMLTIPDGFFSVDYKRDFLSAQEYNGAHRRAMIAPHKRGYQRPGVRVAANSFNKYRYVADDIELPLLEEVIQIGFR